MKHTTELPPAPTLTPGAEQILNNIPTSQEQEVANQQFGDDMDMAALQPEMPALTEQAPAPSQARLLDHVKDLAEKVQGYAYYAAHQTTTTLRGGAERTTFTSHMPKFLTDTAAKLQNVSNAIFSREKTAKAEGESALLAAESRAEKTKAWTKMWATRALLGTGSVAVGAVASILKGDVAAAAAVAPSVNRGMGNEFTPDVDVDTSSAAGIGEPAPDMTLAASTEPLPVSDEHVQAAPAEHLPDSGEAGGETTLSPAPDLAENFAQQIGLETEDGDLVTEGLEPWEENPEEGELFQPGTGYNTMEDLLREAGLTTEQIKELDESGQLRDIVGDMLHESGVTYSSEASEYPDMRLDTELPQGFQFKVSDELLDKIYDLNPPEMSVSGALESMELSDEQIAALNSGAGDWDQNQIDALYAGTGIEPPTAGEVHSLSDLPVPDSLEDRQHFINNLHGLISEELNEATSEEESEGGGIHPAVPIALAGVAGAGLAAGGTILAARQRGRTLRNQLGRVRQQRHERTEELREVRETLEEERRRREWLDNNTPIDFTRYNNHHSGDTYREDVRNALMHEIASTGITTRRQLRDTVDDWIEFAFGRGAPIAVAERAERIQNLYEGLTDPARGRPFVHPDADEINDHNGLNVPVVEFGSGASRVDPHFAENLRLLMAETQEAYAQYLEDRGETYNADFWNQIGSREVPLSSLLMGVRARFTRAQR